MHGAARPCKPIELGLLIGACVAENRVARYLKTRSKAFRSPVLSLRFQHIYDLLKRRSVSLYNLTLKLVPVN